MRISDGTVRLYFAAGELAIDAADKEADVLQALKTSWDVGTNEDLIVTGARFFQGYKHYRDLALKQATQLIELRVELLLSSASASDQSKSKANKIACFKSDEPNATLAIATVPQFAERLAAVGAGVVVVGATFVYALVPDDLALLPLPLNELTTALGCKPRVTPGRYKRAPGHCEVIFFAHTHARAAQLLGAQA
jgi:alanyl-tRNA synthetase